MACCPFSMKNNLSPSQHNASSSTPSAADRQSSVHQFEEEDISVLNCKNLNQAINILIRPSVNQCPIYRRGVEIHAFSHVRGRMRHEKLIGQEEIAERERGVEEEVEETKMQ
ncbi:hypothetical protein M8J75_007777 [Diaphorina citri]|nr:hypothetical protein M8J75_007777 [Diaphorina citri]